MLSQPVKVAGADYYLFFAGCMFLTALGFIPYAMRYKEKRIFKMSPIRVVSMSKAPIGNVILV